MPNHFEIGQNDLPSDKPPDDEVCDMATGYVDGFERAMGVLGLDVEAMEEWLLDHNIERCPSCDWFVASHELLNDEGEIDGLCDNCRS
ncbi:MULTISPECIES: hypothetical protein [Acidithiobacillus]|nr:MULTISPECIES: hypothetical protein [Acidithiobacillus]MEB8476677.1 hypothetical protein [Acidithiobacillus ferriphilus]MEB8485998.1 hypothetical protein [Acidithiobacillus ferriphilus]MEB8489597.1 hypothetical protein [Acidithiobacillus ferriphilus]MEB8492482.1 hypothetical protein [Acidithiobacillus ferriphilus]MEB8515421.1 hypothetical protein [Acidithiobacillus ferriphilus]